MFEFVGMAADDLFFDRQNRISAEDFAWKQMKAQEDAYGRQIQTRVKDARAAGINPLAALGVAPWSPNSQRVFQSESNWGATGAAIDSMIFGREQKQLILEKLKAEIKYQNALTDSLTGDNKSPAPDFNKSSDNERQIQVMPKQVTHGDKGSESGVIQAEQVAENKNGSFSFVMSESISEPAESDWAYNVKNLIRKGIKAGKNTLQSMGFNVYDKEKLEKNLIKERKLMETSLRQMGKLKKGHELRYDITWDEWFQRPIKNGRSFIMDGDPYFFKDTSKYNYPGSSLHEKKKLRRYKGHQNQKVVNKMKALGL